MTEGAGAQGTERVAAAGKLKAARSRFPSKLFIEWLLCVAGAVIVVFLQSGGWLTEDDVAADARYDALMRYHVGVSQERPTYPFAFIAIDEESFASWNEPLITPRDKLADIIAFALHSKAKLIFLDVELTRFQDGTPFRQKLPANENSGGCEKLGSEDAKLCSVLRQPHETPIILARTIVSVRDGASGAQRRIIRRSFLDPILPSLAGVYWASPLYAIDKDRLIRRGRLWELACLDKDTENKDVQAIPSVELLSAALLDNPETAPKLVDIMQRIPKRDGYSDCLDRPQDRHSDDPLKLRLSDGRIFDIDLRQDTARNRILYSIGWSSQQSRLYGDQPQREQRPRVVMRTNDRETDLVTTIPAVKIIEKFKKLKELEKLPMAERTDAQDAARSLLEGHIVVIGATHSQAGDLHETPVGMMPGVVIIMNAIHSLQQYPQMSEPPIWMKLWLSLVIITVSVIVHHLLWREMAILVVPLVILAVAFVLNILFVQHRIWIDAAIPALIYHIFHVIHYYVVELHARAKERRRPGSNWITPWLRALLH